MEQRLPRSKWGSSNDQQQQQTVESDEPSGDASPLSAQQARVSALLNEAAVPFNLFVGWLANTGYIERTTDVDSFASINPSIIDELLANNAAVLKRCITINAPSK
jgi:hypothetical protein